MEGFYEHIVKKTKTGMDGIYTAAIILGAVFILFYGAPFVAGLVGFPFLSAILQVLTVYAVYYLMTGQGMEYEYTLTNTELDVDVIYGKRKRKRVESINCKEFLILAPYNEGEYINEYKEYKVINCAGNKLSQNCYFAAYEKNGAKVCLLFEPTEAMLRAMKKFMPNKVIIDESI